MPDQFRTTLSAVVWAATTDEAQTQIDNARAALPADDQGSLLATIEYVVDGRPEPPTAPEPVPES